MKKVIYGSPGTGKTSYLIKLIELELKKRDFDDVAYMTFTKKASEDAKLRISNEIGVSQRDLKYFGTIHSMCYRLVKKEGMKVIGDNTKYFADFCKLYNYSYGSSIFNSEDLVGDISNVNYVGNIMLDMYERARLLYPNDNQMYEKYWQKFMHYYKEYVPFDMFKLFIDNWEVYKYDNDLLDFVDMLEMTLRRNIDMPPIVQFYDEHQDISPLIYEVYKHFTKNAEQVYVAGDPYQSIYGFIGTSPSFFLTERFDEEIVLPHSFRLSRQIWEYAKNYISRKDMRHYDISSVKPIDNEGSVKIYNHFDTSYLNGGTTYILARIWRFLSDFRNELIHKGIPFTMGKGNVWNGRLIGVNNALYDLYNSDYLQHSDVSHLIYCCPDQILNKGIKERYKRKYIRNKIVSRKEVENYFVGNYGKAELFNKLNLSYFQKLALDKRLGALKKVDKVNLYLGTIHSVKGLEADNVILSNEITNNIWDKAVEYQMREEARVFFVGMTRARNNLILLDEPFGRMGFPIN